MNGISLLSAGLRSGTTFVVALGVTGLLAQFTLAPPIFLALVSSLTVAVVARALGVQEPFSRGPIGALGPGKQGASNQQLPL